MTIIHYLMFDASLQHFTKIYVTLQEFTKVYTSQKTNDHHTLLDVWCKFTTLYKTLRNFTKVYIQQCSSLTVMSFVNNIKLDHHMMWTIVLTIIQRFTPNNVQHSHWHVCMVYCFTHQTQLFGQLHPAWIHTTQVLLDPLQVCGVNWCMQCCCSAVMIQRICLVCGVNLDQVGKLMPLLNLPHLEHTRSVSQTHLIWYELFTLTM